MTSMTFHAFCAHKEREATDAKLAPWLTELDAHIEGDAAISNAWSRALFGGAFYVSAARDDVPSTSLVFVQSHDGNTGAKNPSALGGGETDKHLVYEGLSRVAVDAVMAGAETIRGGSIVFSVWHPELVSLRQSLGLPRHPVQVIATLRGLDLVDGLLFNAPELRVVIVTVPGCDREFRAALRDRPWIHTLVMDRPKDIGTALAELRRNGIRTLSCVGGRTLAAQLIDAGLVNDLYLTTSPKNGGEPNTPLYSKPLDAERVLRKRGTGADVGVRFEHFRFRRAVSA